GPGPRKTRRPRAGRRGPGRGSEWAWESQGDEARWIGGGEIASRTDATSRTDASGIKVWRARKFASATSIPSGGGLTGPAHPASPARAPAEPATQAGRGPQPGRRDAEDQPRLRHRHQVVADHVEPDQLDPEVRLRAGRGEGVLHPRRNALGPVAEVAARVLVVLHQLGRPVDGKEGLGGGATRKAPLAVLVVAEEVLRPQRSRGEPPAHGRAEPEYLVDLV